MAFCTQCGAPVADGAKFCTSCGAKMEVPAPKAEPASQSAPRQQEYTAPQETFEAPKQEYTAPQQTYTAPAQQEYTAPQQTYTAPAQQEYTAPQQQTYTAPAQQEYTAPQQQTYTAPVQQSYAAPAAQKTKKKSKAGLIIGIAAGVVVVLAIALVLILGGKGGSGAASDDPMVGTWNAVSAEMLGYSMDIADVYPDGFSLELKAGGKAAMSISGTNGNGKWSYENDVFTLSGSGLDCTGKVVNGQLVLENLMDSGMNLYFNKEGGNPDIGTVDSDGDIDENGNVADGDTDAAAAQTPLQQWWGGDWYGWWCSTSCSGEFEEWEGMWWDTCAHIDVAADGTASFVIWDEDFSKDEPLSEITFTVSEDSGSGEMGAAISESGYFMDEAVAHADFIVDPTLSEYENMMTLDYWYETDDGDFYMTMYLRPWGQIWDDVAAAAPDDLPYYYADWYLPAIEAGAAMPDTINGEYVAGSGSAASANTASAAAPAAAGNNVFDYAGWGEITMNYPDNYAIDTASIVDKIKSDDGKNWICINTRSGSDPEGIDAMFQSYKDYEGWSVGTMTIAGYEAKTCTYYDDFWDEAYCTMVEIDFGGHTNSGAYGMSFSCYSTESMEDTLNADMMGMLNSLTAVLK